MLLLQAPLTPPLSSIKPTQTLRVYRRRPYGANTAGYGSVAAGYASPVPQSYGGYAHTPVRHSGTPGLIDPGIMTPVPMATPARALSQPQLHLRPEEEVERLWAEGMALLQHRKIQKQVCVEGKPMRKVNLELWLCEV